MWHYALPTIFCAVYIHLMFSLSSSSPVLVSDFAVITVIFGLSSKLAIKIRLLVFSMFKSSFFALEPGSIPTPHYSAHIVFLFMLKLISSIYSSWLFYRHDHGSKSIADGESMQRIMILSCLKCSLFTNLCSWNPRTSMFDYKNWCTSLSQLSLKCSCVQLWNDKIPPALY